MLTNVIYFKHLKHL